MQGTRHSVTGADGVSIGLLTAGTGRPLLLVHGGMGQLERWEPMWGPLTQRWRVTAMDRRGRGSSGDAAPYSLSKEYADVAAVASWLAGQDGGPVDAFGHSYGATCLLGAAALGAPFRRMALYEPPGPQTVPREWVDRVTALIGEGRVGRAMVSFLTEIIGLTGEQIEELKAAPAGYDIFSVVTATLPREAEALTGVDLPGAARMVTCPALLLLGATSPQWAGEITRELAAALPAAELVVLPGQGHEAVDSVPEVVVRVLDRFFDADVPGVASG